MKYFYIIESSNICYKRRGSFMLAQQRGITNLDILIEEHLFKECCRMPISMNHCKKTIFL